MFNLTDSFPNLVAEQMRYDAMLAEERVELAKLRDLEVPDGPDMLNWEAMIQETQSFRNNFMDASHDLWAALDDTSWGWGKYQDETRKVLNNTASIEQGLSRLLNALSGEDHSNVQQEKDTLAKRLINFNKSLAKLGAKRNIIMEDEANAYMPMLFEYVNLGNNITDIIKKQLSESEKEIDAAAIIREELTDPESRLMQLTRPISYHLPLLSSKDISDLQKLADKHQLQFLKLNSDAKFLNKWIDDSEVSEVRRAQYEIYNRRPVNSPDAVWLAKVKRQVLDEAIRRKTLLGKKKVCALRRVLTTSPKSGKVQLVKAEFHSNIVSAELNKFLCDHPGVTVEDIFQKQFITNKETL
ncbi:hypothetical protein FC18_GL002107 [Lacticaseibacillus sharpeae JCM 1186 = DSM 20505]|uniref:Uncharacterized protein n=2 Tax=Lacticaseibacillus sharpeae TaxID=1626 RepID=A0A0R1ZSK9_9LACO|nr:hypothetical protein FC18_GL002107 [Lacticaseibacillus sharpeae JCM 1186 = DSM 20505]